MSTMVRNEKKFLVLPEQRGPLIERLRARMGEPSACAIRSVYFDGPGGGLARLAVDNPWFHVTVRAREYDPVQDGACPSPVWLEVKMRLGEQCTKSRCELDAAEIAPLLSACDLYALVGRVRHEDVLQEPRLHRTLGPFAGRPGAYPVGVVTCRRLAFGGPDVRVTIDMDLAYLPAPEGLYRNVRDLRSAALPAPWDVEQRAILEIKSRAPCDLDALTQDLAQVEYSKFVRLVHERSRQMLTRGRHADLLRRD